MTNPGALAKQRRGPEGTMSDPLVLIPARLGATRLPNKPLAGIAGEPMVVHTWRRACEAGIGPVAVATDAPAIADAVRAAGGAVVMTRADHPSGSDRIAEAVEALDPEGRHDVVVNVQGDFPTIDPRSIAAVAAPLLDPTVDLATLVCLAREDERTNPNVVKMIGTEVAPGRFRALYFTRATAPSGEGPLWHHIGVNAYRRRALQRFDALPPSPLEIRERLEQLRAVEAGFRIDAVAVNDVPFGVDTPEQLEEARRLLAERPGP